MNVSDDLERATIIVVASAVLTTLFRASDHEAFRGSTLASPHQPTGNVPSQDSSRTRAWFPAAPKSESTVRGKLNSQASSPLPTTETPEREAHGEETHPIEAQPKERQPNRQMSGLLASRSINWDTVKRGYPIPRAMPSSDSDDPLDAGFAIEWVVRALNSATGPVNGSDPMRREGLDARSFAALVISEFKRPDDSWAYGLEYEVRQFVESELRPGPDTVIRQFCNAHGCLFYFEGMSRGVLSTVTGAFLSNPQLRQYGIGLRDTWWTIGTDPEFRRKWNLILVTRSAESRRFVRPSH